MKNLTTNPFRFIPAALGLVFCLLAWHVGAAVVTWDPQGTVTTPNNGSWYTGDLSQSWEGANWDTANQTGTPTRHAWNENTAALFSVHSGTGTPIFTVTMSANHTCAGIFDGSLTPNPCQVVISGNGTFILGPNNNNAMTPTVDTADPGIITIYNVIAGGAGANITFEDPSTVAFYGVNTYSGDNQIGYSGLSFRGTINFNNSASFGVGSLVISNTSTAIAALQNMAPASGSITLANKVIVGIYSGLPNPMLNFAAQNTPVTTTLSGNWTLNAANAIIGAGPNVANPVNITGNIANGTAPGGGLQLFDPGTLTISGANTFTGNIIIGDGMYAPGTLVIGGSGTLGNTSPGIGSYAGTIFITNNVAFSQNGTFSYISSAEQTLSGAISGGGILLVNGAGWLTLSGANTYTGNTTVSAGILDFYNTTARSTGPSAVSVASGATLALGLGGGGSWASTDIDNLFGNTFASVTMTAGANVGFDTTAGNFTYATSQAATAYGIMKLGPNTLILSGANSFGSGTLAFGNGAWNCGYIQLANNTTPLGGYTAVNEAGTGNGVCGLNIDGGITCALPITSNLRNNFTTTGYVLHSVTGNNLWSGNITATTAGEYGILCDGTGTLALGGTLGNTAPSGTAAIYDLVPTGSIIVLGTFADGTPTPTGVNCDGPGLVTIGPGSVNIYSGATTVNGGTLLVDGSLGAASAVSVTTAGTLGGSGTINGTVTVANSGTLAPGDGITSGTLTIANATASALTLNTSGLTFYLTTPATPGTTYDVLNVTGTVVLNGLNIVTPTTSTTIAAGTYTLMNYGAYSGSGTFVLPNGLTTDGNFTLVQNPTTLVLSVSVVTPGDYYWTGSASGVWDISTTANWSYGGGPVDYADGDAVVFDDSHLSGSAVTVVVAGANPVVTPSSVAFDNSTHNYSVAIPISGALTPLVKNGSGSLDLAAANTYTGPSTINNGVVKLDALETPGTSGPLGDQPANAANTVFMDGGTLQYAAPNAAGDYSGRFGTAAGQLYNIDVNGQTVTFARALISAGGALTLKDTAGGGTLKLAAANTYTGSTTLAGGIAQADFAESSPTAGPFGAANNAITFSGGTLQYAAPNSAFDYSPRFTLANNTAYKIDENGQTVSFATGLTGTGSTLTLSDTAGSGSLTLNGASTYTGITTIGTGASLIIGSTGLLGAGGSYSANITDNGALTDASSAGTPPFHALGGTISGTGSVTVNNAAACLQMAGADTYTGGTFITSGILQLNHAGGPLPTSTTITFGSPTTYGMLDLDGRNQTVVGLVVAGGATASSQIISNSAAGSPTLNVSGGGSFTGNIINGSGVGAVGLNVSAGSLILSGVNTYSGSTTIGSGATLTISGAGTLGASASYAGTIPNSGTFVYSSSAADTLSGVISGTGALTVSGAGTLTLSGVETYTGTTTINNGSTLTVGNPGKLLAADAITDNGTFNWNSAISATLSGIISGNGVFNVGAGSACQLTLSGANTYSGQTYIYNGSEVYINSDGNLGTPPVALVPNQLQLNGGFLAALTPSFSLAVTRGIYLSGGITVAGYSGPTIPGYSSLLGGAIQVGYTAGSVTLTIPVAITDSGSGGPVMMFGSGLAQYGVGTNSLTIASTYSGATGISTGRLLLGGNNFLPSGTPLVMAADKAANGIGSILDLQTFSQTIGPLYSVADFIAPAGTATPTILMTGGSGGLTVNEGTTASAFNGQIEGNGALTLNGSSGVLTLGHANTYSAGTIINGGTLDGSVASSIPAGSGIEVNNPGVLQLDNNAAISAGAVLLLDGTPNEVYLNFPVGTPQAVSQLWINGIQAAAGTWGFSGAQHNSAVFTATSTGLLNVSSGITPTIAITSISPNPACVGSTVTLVATVGAGNPGSPPSGTVTFYNGVTPLGTEPLIGGTTATLPGVSLPANTYANLTAKYSGDAYNNTATSAPASPSLVVNALPTVTVNSTTICTGGSATLTATLDPTTSGDSPTYLWNDPTSATTASVTVSPAATTTYTVTVTDTVTTCANSGSGTVTVQSCGPVVEVTNITYSAGTATITGTGVVSTATWFLKASSAINTPTPWTSINSGGPVPGNSVITVADPTAGSYSQRFYYLTNQ